MSRSRGLRRSLGMWQYIHRRKFRAGRRRTQSASYTLLTIFFIEQIYIPTSAGTAVRSNTSHSFAGRSLSLVQSTHDALEIQSVESLRTPPSSKESRRSLRQVPEQSDDRITTSNEAETGSDFGGF